MESKSENRNTKIGFTISVVFHGLLLLLFFFLMAWRAPNPPNPEYGIELNFGLDDGGSGEIQTKDPFVDQNDKLADAKPEDPSTTENTDEATTEEVKDKTLPQEEIKPEPEDENNILPKKETAPKEVNPKPTPVDEPKKVVNKEEAAVNKDGAKGIVGENKGSNANNNGDNAEKKGDQGNPKGTLDSKALYGTPGGGGGGANLDMAGWMWDSKPVIKDESSESGKIVFEVKIDAEGEILSIRKLEASVSPAIVQLYEKEVRKISFSKTSGAATAASSTGRITFIIRSR